MDFQSMLMVPARIALVPANLTLPRVRSSEPMAIDRCARAEHSGTWQGAPR